MRTKASTTVNSASSAHRRSSIRARSSSRRRATASSLGRDADDRITRSQANPVAPLRITLPMLCSWPSFSHVRTNHHIALGEFAAHSGVSCMDYGLLGEPLWPLRAMPKPPELLLEGRIGPDTINSVGRAGGRAAPL